MGVIDLSAYKPTAATLGDANQIRNGFTALETLLNGNVDNNNFGAGKIFDPSKLMQNAATDGQGLLWDAATTSWKPANAKTGQLSMSVGQSIPNGASTQIVLGAGLTGAPWGGVTLHATPDGLIAPITGIWLVHIYFAFAANATGIRQLDMRKYSAVNVLQKHQYDDWIPNATGDEHNVAMVISLNAGEYVTPWIYQSSGGALALNTCELSMAKVG